MVFSRVDSGNSSDQKFLLVVDSNTAGASGIKALLKQFRYKVWSVNSATEALELSDIVMPSLVLVREMADMTQVDFTKEFKRLDSSGKASVLVITSGKDEASERACLSAGAVTCLRLPLNFETLYRTIQVAIEQVPRMNLRINTKFPVVIEDKTVNCNHEKFATTLSESGLFLPTPDPCPLKTKIPLKFEVAGKVLSAEALVIYSHKRGNQTNCKPGMGLQFIRISDRDQEQIRLFIREEIRKGISTSRIPDPALAGQSCR